jgi:1-deoxy-D-xylulose-5-phosphate synthase
VRYPKTTAADIARELQPIELGKSEVFGFGSDGTIIACGTTLQACLDAAETLRLEGFDIGVVNARFVKPIDQDMIRGAITESAFVVTVEEAMLMGGFGSALLEAANDMRLDATKVHRIGIPDLFVEHQSRSEVLAELKLDAAGVAETCREIAKQIGSTSRVAT